MKNSILVRVMAGLFMLGMVGVSAAADSKKPNSPPPQQIFRIDVFGEADAQALWPTGAEAYATQEEAAVDFPDASLEAFFWSNVVVKEGTLAFLEGLDSDGDGLLLMQYVVKKHGYHARTFPDYNPLYMFIIGDIPPGFSGANGH